MPATVAYICQGCGEMSSDVAKMHARGLISTKYYCERCVEHADAYLKARDELHTSIAQSWSDGLVDLANEFSKSLKVLPDA